MVNNLEILESYLGANFNYDNGYRDHSESYLNTVFGDVRYRPNQDTEFLLILGKLIQI